MALERLMASVDLVALEGLVVSEDSDVLSWTGYKPWLFAGLSCTVVLLGLLLGTWEALGLATVVRWCGSQAAVVTDPGHLEPLPCL